MTTSPDITKAAAMKLLKSGLITVSEAARLAGTSKQRVDYWVRAAGLDPAEARKRFLEKAWRGGLRAAKKGA